MLNRMLLGMLLLMGTSRAGAGVGDVMPGSGHLDIAANSHEIIFISQTDLRSTERGFVTFTPAIERQRRVNEAGDFTFTVGGSLFINGEVYAASATVGSISDDGEIVWFNPAGQLHSNERGLLANFGPYALSGVDVNSSGQYTWSTQGYPIQPIWHSGLGQIGMGLNPRINNAGTVCWTGLVLGRKWPVCDGEPLDFEPPRPQIAGGRHYSVAYAESMDITDDELIVQVVWFSAFAETQYYGLAHQLVRVPLSSH